MNMNKASACHLEFVREDDFVEYFLFPEIPEDLISLNENEDTKRQGLEDLLQTILGQCMDIVNKLVNEQSYIWHKDEFQLRLRTGSGTERMLNDEINEKESRLPPHLHGVTHYGDNINDEWFIVYLLHVLTKEIPNLVGRVIDSDGEFLLIEAADALPKWANPETCEQRVYIFNGEVHLVQNSPSNTTKPLSVESALFKIRQQPTLYKVSQEIKKCLEERMKIFRDPAKYTANSHRQILCLPQGVAIVLKQKPSLISAAVRAFCERDPIDMRACRTMRFFPPEQIIRTNVLFTKCLYAMLSHSNYVPDRKIGWKLCSDTSSEQYKEELLGIKLACGFEILASQAKTSNEQNDKAWKSYVRSLTSKGYFRDNVEGSQEYQRLLESAKSYFNSNNERFRTAPIVGKEVLELLQNSEVTLEQLRDEENNLRQSDPDDWLSIDEETLDAMLMERYGPKKLYQANGEMNAAEFAKNLTDFLEKQSTFEGIDDSDDTDENDTKTKSPSHSAANSSKVKKNASMRKACQDHPMSAKATASTSAAYQMQQENDTTHVRNFLDFNIPEDNWESTSEMSDYEDEDDLERNFEAMSKSENHIDAEIQAYMAQMDRELSKTTVGKTFTSTNKARVDSDDDEFNDIENFKPIDINVNTLKNMMDSYKSQMGGSGPVSNLLNAMGVGISNLATNKDDKDLSESTV